MRTSFAQSSSDMLFTGDVVGTWLAGTLLKYFFLSMYRYWHLTDGLGYEWALNWFPQEGVPNKLRIRMLVLTINKGVILKIYQY